MAKRDPIQVPFSSELGRGLHGKKVKRAPVRVDAQPNAQFFPSWLIDTLAALVVWLTCNWYYQAAPEHQLTDSQYLMIQTEFGLDHGTWAMNDYLPMPRINASDPPQVDHHGVPGLPYQLQVVPDGPGEHTALGGRVVYWCPPGTS